MVDYYLFLIVESVGRHWSDVWSEVMILKGVDVTNSVPYMSHKRKDHERS
jgi:hypothetical protein